MAHAVESAEIERPASIACGPSGGLFGFDQEVVTLSVPCMGLSSAATSANSGSRRDLTPGGNPNAPVELRSTQSDRSKSQPPHLVYGWYIYCHFQNLSSDHLLSGVFAH